MQHAKRKLLAGAVVALAVVGGGVAFGATQFGSPKKESQAVVADAAKQLGIEPAKLSAALKKALENRVDAAVAAGRLTRAEGDALKARIESGEAPLFPLGGHHRDGFRHHGPNLDAAATYLGLTEQQLRTELEGGETLAQVAKAHGRTVEGLVQAVVDSAKEKLDAAVTAGRLTRAEADSMLAHLEERIADFVNGRFPGRFGDHHGGRGFHRGPGAFFSPPPGP